MYDSVAGRIACLTMSRVRDADVLDHQERRRAHHRRHDLAVDRAHGLDRAGLDAAVAGLLHQRDREDAARDHVAHRRARDHAVERRRHHGHLGRAAAQVAERGEAHLHHVVAAAGAIEQRAEQHVDEDRAGRHAERDAEHALGGEPQVRQQAVERRALVRQHLGHVGAEHRVGDEQRGQHRHRPADGAPRGLEQQHEPDARDHDVHRRRLPRARAPARCRTAAGRRRQTRRPAPAPSRPPARSRAASA